MPAVTLIQHTHCPSVAGNSIDAYTGRLTSLVLSGNIVIVGIKHGAATTPTITDDKSNTYTLGVTVDDGNDEINIFYSANVTNGPRVVTASFGASTAWVQMTISEFAGIAASLVSDGTSTNTGGGDDSPTALTAGAIVTTVNGDLIYNFVEQDSTSDAITGWTQGTNFTLLSADRADSIACQFWVQTTAGSINAAMTMTESQAGALNWMSAAMAFKADSGQGTLPPTGQIWIRRAHHLSVKNAHATPVAWQIPCDAGNLLVFTWIRGDHPITSFTDNHSNTWTEVDDFVAPGAAGTIAIYYALNPTLNNDLVITVAFSNSPTNTVDSMQTYEIVNAHETNPIGVQATASGFEAGSGTWIGATITPTSAKGIVLSVLGAENSGSDFVDAFTPGYFISTTTDPENISPWPADSNNGWGVQYHTTTDSIQHTWTDSTGAPLNWGEISVDIIESPGQAQTDLEGYRWRNDDGSETTATWKANQDTDTSSDKDIAVRVRAILNTTHNLASAQFQLEAALDGTEGWFKVGSNNG